MEALPFKEMIPVHQSPNVFVLSKPGQIYLAYATEAGPIEFKLEGEKSYNVEAIDTWNMTIKALDLAKPGDYTFNAPDGGFLLRFTAN
jgi:hypothetical protein